MSNQEKESGKPKLREIKKTTASRQFLSGAGTGPNDCMSPEIYSALCDMGALKSDVYVCGQGWLGPDDYKGGGSSSGGCGTSGTSGSWSGSSGGSSGDYIDWKVGILAAIGGMIGGILGSKLLKKISNRVLKLGFTIFLLYVSIRMLFF